MSKNKWFIVALVLVFALSACAAPAAEEAAPAAEEAAPAEEEVMEAVDPADLTFAICVKSIGANWFSRLEEGIIEFAEETGATTFLCGPSKGDPAAQIGILEEIIAQEVDGIGNVPFGVEEHEPVHKKSSGCRNPRCSPRSSFRKECNI